MTDARWPAVALYLATLLAAFTLALTSYTLYDFWWYLKSGEEIVARGTVPTTDPFSYTAQGRPWVNHMWATQLLVYLVWRAWGPVALILGKAAVIAATFGVVLLTMRRRGVHPIAASAVTLLAAWAGSLFWHVRPQIVTYFLLAALLYLLREGWERRRGLWLVLPALMIPWVNLHAGFLTGLGVLALVGAGAACSRLARPGREREIGPVVRRAAVLGGLVALATLANPFGIQAILFPLEVVNTRLFMVSTYEWFSPNFHDPRYRGFEAMLLLLVPAFAWGRARLGATDVLVVLTFAHLGLNSVRHIPLFVVAAAPPLADALESAARDLWARRGAGWARLATVRAQMPWLWPLMARPATPLVALAFILLVGTASTWIGFVEPVANPFQVDLNERRYPERATAFIKRERLPGRLFNTYAWGGYELWRLYPDYQVFIDGRTHVYGKEVLQDFLDVTYLAPGWEGVLDRWGVETVLAERGAVLVRALAATDRWSLVLADREALVFVRRSETNRALIARVGTVGLDDPLPEVMAALDAGLTAAEAGQDDRAIGHFREVLALEPDHPAALLSLAMLREKQGETREARTLFERVVSVDPGGVLAGRARERLGRLR